MKDLRESNKLEWSAINCHPNTESETFLSYSSHEAGQTREMH
jgi:hypothetical protein